MRAENTITRSFPWLETGWETLLETTCRLHLWKTWQCMLYC